MRFEIGVDGSRAAGVARSARRPSRPRVAIIHDYLTQRGGAERVVLSMLRAFPDAPLFTSLYEQDGTFPEFRDADVRTLPLDRLRPLRQNHRLAFPLLAAAFSGLRVDADVALCSSSGWAHGARANGRKVVYCHTPARWLYQGDTYLRGRPLVERGALMLLRPFLRRWDRRSARTAHRYLTTSTVVRDRIRAGYGIEAQLVPPPYAIEPLGPEVEVPGLREPFYLCVSRLLPYKNVDAVIEAFAALRGQTLVVVGTGPEERRLQACATSNVRFISRASDAQLGWLYAHSRGLVSASFEDFGLTPLEAAAFGKPSAVLRWGGFLDTVVEGQTGVFFAEPSPSSIRDALRRLERIEFREDSIRQHAKRYAERSFIEQLRSIVEEEGELTA